MSWSITWSWQAPRRIAALAPLKGCMVVSIGHNLLMIEADGSIRWKVELPFKAHCAQANTAGLGILAAHAFYVLSTSDGAMLHDGRSTTGCITHILARPVAGALLSGRPSPPHPLPPPLQYPV